MQKWKLLNLFKATEEFPVETQTTMEHIGEPEEKSEEISIKEYNETLYSKGFIQKESAVTLVEKKQSLKRSRWKSLGTIEHRVDKMSSK